MKNVLKAACICAVVLLFAYAYGALSQASWNPAEWDTTTREVVVGGGATISFCLAILVVITSEE